MRAFDCRDLDGDEEDAGASEETNSSTMALTIAESSESGRAATVSELSAAIGLLGLASGSVRGAALDVARIDAGRF